MCDAFVYGIADTKASASRPCDHQIVWRTTRNAPSLAPIASKPCAATQPAGENSL